MSFARYGSPNVNDRHHGELQLQTQSGIFEQNLCTLHSTPIFGRFNDSTVGEAAPVMKKQMTSWNHPDKTYL